MDETPLKGIPGLKGLRGEPLFGALESDYLLNNSSVFNISQASSNLYLDETSKRELGKRLNETDDIRAIQSSYRGGTHELIAERQSVGNKWANAAAKMAITAGTTFLDGTIGTVWGLGELLAGGSFVNNQFSNAMADISEWQEKVLPNYYTKEELESPWYTNLGTANFWADKVLKNFGFTVGAVYSGMAWSGAARQLPFLATKGLQRNIAKGIAEKHFKGNLENALKAVKSGKINPEMLTQELLKDAKALSMRNAVQQVIGATSGAIGESRIESISNARVFEEQKLPEIEANISSRIPEFEAEGQALGLYGDALLEFVDNKYNDEKGKELQRLKEITDAYRNVNFMMGFAILSLSNWAQFKSSFQGGYSPHKRILNAIKGDKKVAEGIYNLEKDVARTTIGKVGRKLKKTAEIIGNPFTEGLEEMSQGVVKDTGDEFFGKKFDGDSSQTIMDYFHTFAKEFLHTATTPDKWEEFFIGMLMGGPGVPIVSGRGVSVSGGIWGDISDMKKDNAYTEEVIKKWNEFIESDRFKNNYQGLVRHLSYQKEMDKALDEGDVLAFKNAEHKQFVGDVITAIEAGQFDALVSFYEGLGNSEAEILKDMTRVTRDEQGNELPQEQQKSSFDGIEDKDVKAYYTKRGRKLADNAKKISELRDAIEVKFGDSMSAAMKEMLLAQMSSIENTEERIEKLYKELPTEISALVKETIEIKAGSLKEGQVVLKGDVEELGKVINNYVKNNPSKFGVNETVKDIIKLTNQRVQLVDFYNTMVSEDGKAKMAKLEETFNEQIVEATRLGKLRQIDNNKKQLESIANETLFDETFKDPNTGEPVERTHKGEISLNILKDASGETITERFQVEEIDPDTGELVLNRVKVDKKGVSTPTGEIIRIGVSEGIELQPDVAEGSKGMGYFVTSKGDTGYWMDYSIEKTAKENRRDKLTKFLVEYHEKAITELKEDVLARKKEMTNIKSIKTAIKEALKRAKGRKGRFEGKAKISTNTLTTLGLEDSKVQELLDKLGLDTSFASRASVLLNITQLKLIDSYLANHQESIKENSAKLKDSITTLKEELKDKPEKSDFSALESLLSELNSIKDNLTAQQDEANKLKKDLDVEATIKKLDSFIQGLHKRLTTLNKQKDIYDEQGLLAKYEKALSEGKDITDIDGVNLEMLEDLMLRIKHAESILPKVTQRKILAQEELDKINAELERIAKIFEDTKLNERIEHYEKIVESVKGALLATMIEFSIGETVPIGEDILSGNKNDIESEEANDTSSSVYEPSLPVFKGHKTVFMRTTTNQEKFTEEVKNGDETHEPEVLFQDFLGQYQISTPEDSAEHKHLLAFTAQTLLDKYGEHLTEKQKKRLVEVEDTIFVVVHNKDGSPLLDDSIVHPKHKSLVYTVINGKFQRDLASKELMNLRTSKYPIVTLDEHEEYLTKQNEKKKEGKLTQQEIKEQAKKNFQAQAQKYETEVLEPILASNDKGEPFRLEIVGRSAGVPLKNKKEKTGGLKGLMEVLGVKKPKKVNIVIGDTKTELSSGMRSGFVYFETSDGLTHRAFRQTLSVPDQDRVLALLEGLKNKTTYQEAREIMLEIDKITMFYSEHIGRKSPSPFRFYVASDGRKNNAGDAIITEVVVGDRRIKISDLGKEGATEIIRKFLATKYYNVSKNVSEPRGVFTIMKLDKDGKFVEDITFDADAGGYYGYLMDEKNPKIKAKELETPANRKDRILNPTRVNRAIEFSGKGMVKASSKNESKDDSTNEIDWRATRKLWAKKYPNKTETQLKRIKDKPLVFKKGKKKKKKGTGKGTEQHTPEQLALLEMFGGSLGTVKEGMFDEKIDMAFSLGEDKGTKATKGKVTDPETKKADTEVEINIDKSFIEAAKKGVEPYQEEKIDPKQEALIKKWMDKLGVTRDEAIAIIVGNSRIGIEGEIPGNIQEELDKFSEIFPDTIVKIVADNMLGEKVVATFKATKAYAEVLLTAGAADFSLFHEAWHNYSKLFMTKVERAKLYQEVRDQMKGHIVKVQEGNKYIEVKGEKLTDSQAEEFLAEEFRLFIKSAGMGYSFGSANSRKTWFQRILDILKDFFGLITGKNFTIENLFSSIESGTFYNKDRVSFEESSSNRVGKFDEATTNAVVGWMTYNFFNILNASTIFENKYSNLQKVSSHIYESLRDLAELNPVVSQELENWDEFVKEHRKVMKQYTNAFNIEEALSTEEKATRDNTQFIESNKIDARELINSKLKLLIAGLPRMNSNGEFLTIKGLKQSTHYGKTIGILLNQLSDINTVEGMFERLSELADTQNPEFKVLMSRLGIKEDGTIMENATEEQVDLQTSLYVMVHNSNNELHSVVIGDDGNQYIVYNSEATNIRRLIDRWKTNLRMMAENEEGKKYLKQEGNDFFIKPNIKLKLSDGNAVELKDIIEQNLKTDEDRIAYLRLFGIALSENFNDTALLKRVVTYVTSNVVELYKTNGKININDVYNRDILKTQKEFRQLALKEARFTGNFMDNQIVGSDGTIEHSITRKNRIGKVIDDLNEDTIAQHLVPYDPKTGEGNFHTYKSEWYRFTQDGGHIRKGLIRNYGPEVGDKTDISELKPGDFVRAEFTAVLNGIFPFLRSETRSLEYAFDFGKEYIDNNIKESQIIGMLKDYLEAEILEALAYKNLNNKNSLYKKKNYDGLAFFSSLFPEINNTLSKIKSTNPATLSKSTKKIMDANKDLIDQRLQEYVEGVRERTVKVLYDNKIIAVDGKTIRNLGISMEKAKDITGRTDHFKENEINKIVDVFNFYYLMSAIEQTKWITGTPLIYKNDFHKRTTTFASTISGTRNDADYIKHLNREHPRMDSIFGFEHANYYRDVVFDDVIVASPYTTLYKKLVGDNANPYDKQEENNAQGWATMDGYKSFLKRTDVWTEEYEKTYQYQMQYLGQLMVERGDITRQNYLDFFSKHTKSYTPNKYYFNGKELTIGELSPLPIVKPQGTGTYLNKGLDRFSPTQITKLGLAPLLPTDIVNSPHLLDFYIEAMKKGIDFILPVQAKKGEILASEDGTLPQLYNADGTFNPTFNIGEISWNDIGNQLDIDPSGKKKVTTSVQKRRVTFIDMYNGGKIDAKFEGFDAKYNEFVTLERELVERGYKDALDKLGLSESVEDEFKLVDSKQFQDTLKEELERRFVPDNVSESLEAVMTAHNKVFDTIPTRRQLVNVLQSIIRSNAIAIKRSGDMLVQQASTGLETSPRADVKSSNFLKFYRPIKKDGSEYTIEELNSLSTDEIVRIAPAEAMMSLPMSWIPFVEENFEGKNFTEKLRKFNEVLGEEKYKKILTYMANRVPTDHRHSVEALQIVRFLDPAGGSRIVLPTEIVIKSGSDFDIDKLTAYFNNVKFDKKGEPTYIEYSTSDKEVDMRYDRMFMKYRKLENYLKGEASRELVKGMDNLFDEETSGNPLFRMLYEHFEDSEIQEILTDKGINVDIAKVKELAKKEAEKSPTIEEFKTWSIEAQNTKKAIENRLNQLDLEVLLHPGNFASLINPNNSDIFKEMADKYTPISKERVATHRLHEFDFNAAVANNQWTASKLISLGAVGVTSHALTQAHPITINPVLFPIVFPNVKISNPKLGIQVDSEGNVISDTLGAALTASVDAGKEEHPSISRINFTMSTANMYTSLNRSGVGFETIVQLATSPIVKQFESDRRREESAFLQDTDYELSKFKESKDATFERLTEGKPRIGLYKFLEIYLKDPSETNLNILTRKLRDAQNNFKALSSKELASKDSLAALEWFLYYQELSKAFGTLNTTTRHDSALPKDNYEIEIKERKFQRLLDTNVFSREDIQKLFDNSYLGSFKKTHAKSVQLQKNFSLVGKDIYLAEFMNTVLDIYDNPIINKPIENVVSAVRKIENAMVAAIVHNTVVGENGVTLKKYYKGLLKGKNSLPKRLNELKKDPQYKDNPAVQELIGIVNEFIPRTGENLEIDYVKLYNRKFETSESNAITRGLKELINDTDSKVSTLFEDLITFSIIQSGIQSTPFSFMELLPGMDYQSALDALLYKYTNSETKANMLTPNMIDDIFANIGWDSNIVPLQAKTKYNLSPDKTTLTVRKTSQNSQYPYLKMRMATVERSKVWEMKRKGEKVPMETIFYKRVKTEGGNVIYQIMNSRGVPNKFMEFTENGISIINSNNKERTNEKDVIFAEGIMGMKKGELLEDYSQTTGGTVGSEKTEKEFKKDVKDSNKKC